MRRVAICLATSLVAIFSTATPVAAAQYLITYSGTVSEGTDDAGIFGAAGADLTGRAFTVNYTLTAPLSGTLSDDTGTSRYIAGGSGFDPDRPSPVSATVTIGGVLFDISGQYFGQAAQRNGPYDQVYHQANDVIEYDFGGGYSDIYVYTFIKNYSGNMVDTTDYTQSLDYTVQQGDYVEGYFQSFRSGPSIYSYTYANFDLNRVTIASLGTGAVPEPATWAMLILGFGAIGGAMRERRRLSIGKLSRLAAPLAH